MRLHILTFNDEGEILVAKLPDQQQQKSKNKHGWFSANFSVIELPNFIYERSFLECMATVKNCFETWGAKEIIPLAAPKPVKIMQPLDRCYICELLLPLHFPIDGNLQLPDNYRWMNLEHHPTYRFPGKMGEGTELLEAIQKLMPIFDLETTPIFVIS